jgi:hypothetical protein
MEDELVLESMSWIIKEKLSIIRNCQADSSYTSGIETLSIV